MDALENCSLFKKYNDDYLKKYKSEISLVCIFYPNEGLLKNRNGQVYQIFNSGFKHLPVFDNKNVLDFAYATSIVQGKLGYHLLVLTDYEIFGWGRNTYRQISIANQNDIAEPSPIEVKLKSNRLSCKWEKFTMISTSFGHTIASTTRNCLLLWGNNSNGQIGNGTTSSIEAPYRIWFKRSSSQFTQNHLKRLSIINEDSEIVTIACSTKNSYVLLKNGNVYGWGENETGQVGLIHDKNFSVPHLIYSRMKQINAVNSYAMALREDGILFGMGDNSARQIGSYNGSEWYNVPFRFELSFKKFATWNNLSMGLTYDDRCFIWGEYGTVVVAAIRLTIKVGGEKKTDQAGVSSTTSQNSKPIEVNLGDVKEKLKNRHKSRPESVIDSVFSEPSNFEDSDESDLENEENKLNEATAVTVDEQGETNNGNTIETSVESLPNCDQNDEELRKQKEIEEKNEEERRKIREIIKNGKIELHEIEFTIKKPKEIKCKSFSKIVAKRFNMTYYTAKNGCTDLNDEDTDDNDLIDPSNFIVVLYEYEQEVVKEEEIKPPPKIEGNQEEKFKILEQRIIELEKRKATVQKFHFGDKAKHVLFDKSNIERLEDFVVKDIHQVGHQTTGPC